MKLYYSSGACSLSVRIILNELGVAATFEAVDLKTKQTQTGSDFLKINPKGVVPVLQLDNNELLTENVAIQEYLADTYKAEKLLAPLGNFARYRALEWLSFVATDLHKGCGALFNPSVPETVKDEIFRPLLTKKLTIVNQHLAEHTYLLGESFSLPDAYLFVVLRWMPHLKIDMSSYTHLNRYFSLLKERPSISKSMHDEGLKK